MRKGAAGAIALGIILLGASTAQATEASELYGKWCGPITNYRFAPKKLTVEWTAGDSKGTVKQFVVTRYENLDGGWLKMRWIRDNKDQDTNFKISPAGDLVQAANTSGDMGPERHFNKCQ